MEDSLAVIFGFTPPDYTHGLTSSFRRGYDGWIYADHGYNNDTTLTARDGSSIKMNSGNTDRFRHDGSRVEQFTWGQVNPFGLMFDPLGDLWSADCHSSPVYQLLRGAYYPSFGKPHDGLGFAPGVCPHSHAATAIAGIVFYAATNFPPEFRGNTFVGNVMTCRVNRDSYREHGSTRIAKEEPDFLHCDDPWFRPVDLQLGRDGALYVADFYNRIIGHYEVPLDHPGRDRERGRIWRIVHAGQASSRSSAASFQLAGPASIPARSPKAASSFDLSRTSAAGLINQLANPNLTCRMLALNQLVDRIGPPAARPVERMLRSKRAGAEQKSCGLWVLHRLGALKPETLVAAARDPDPLVRVHAMRVLSEMFPEPGALPGPYRQLVFAGLNDSDAYVQRVAADALGQHTHGTEAGAYAPIHRLLDLLRSIPADDTQLLHVGRMALRNHLRMRGAFPSLEAQRLSEQDSRVIAGLALGVPSEESAAFLLHHVRSFPEPRDRLATFLRHAARYAPEVQIDRFEKFIREKFGADPDLQLALFKSAQGGLAQRGAKMSDGLRAWAATLAEHLLSPVDDATAPWVSLPLKGAPTASPWFLQKRKSADGDEASVFLCSLPPDGEKLTGTLRSRPFAIPARLSFHIAAHDGFADQPPGKKNFIRLLAADTREVLTNAPPPRNDIAQRVTWDLSAHAGRRGFLEVVDGDTGNAFAWLAAGRLDPLIVPLPGVNPPEPDQRQVNAAELARTVPLPQLAPRLALAVQDRKNSDAFRAAAARALLAMDTPAYLPPLIATLADTNQPAALREQLALLLADQASLAARAAVIEALLAAPRRLQIKLAISMARQPAGAEALLDFAEHRKLSPQVLADRAVKERLAAAKRVRFDERFAALTQDLAPPSAALQNWMDARRAGFASAPASVERGRLVFEKTCSVCHQLDGKGAVVGPQLDGVGNRGLERIIEDVLDPSRNIDPAFRPSLVTLKDDTSLTGLQRREEGEVLVFVDSQGKEIAVPKKEIVERRESQLSLMPANFGEALPTTEFYDLMAFLLSKGPGAKLP